MTENKEYTAFKQWVKDMLGAGSKVHYNKAGELKFPRYLYICSCGDVDCNDRRTGTSSLNGGPSNLSHSLNIHYMHEHGYWNPINHTSEIYIKEEDVLLKKGQARNLSEYDKKELRRLLK